MVSRKLKVGVAGSGVAGAFATHFLRRALGDRVDITVFERDARVGGRVWQVEIAGSRFEAGGGAIHSANRYMGDAVDRLGLHRTGSDDSDTDANDGGGGGYDRTLSVWNGASFDFHVGGPAQSRVGFFVQRYGDGFSKTHLLVKDAVSRLDAIYGLQEKGESFTTPREMLTALGLYELTQVDGYSYLREHGIDEELILEVSDGLARANYGQSGTMNAFATIISLAGGGMDGGHLYSVVEGNARVVEGLLGQSGARLLTHTPVERIRAIPSASNGPKRYVVETAPGERFELDAVVIATPLELAGIEIDGVPVPKAARAMRAYQTTHVTFVAGIVNQAYFGLKPGDPLPGIVLTRESAAVPFSSFSRVGDATFDALPGAARGVASVYKLFSREALDEAFLDTLFSSRLETFRWVWKAYPVLGPMTEAPPFQIAPGLYYVNAMESAASTMETEAVAARNVVNLITANQGGLRQ